MGTDIIFKEESYRIIGARFEVYKRYTKRGVIGKLRALPENRTRKVRQSILPAKRGGFFAPFACFVVKKDG